MSIDISPAIPGPPHLAMADSLGGLDAIRRPGITMAICPRQPDPTIAGFFDGSALGGRALGEFGCLRTEIGAIAAEAQLEKALGQ